MSVAAKPMTLEDYLNYDDGTDTRYELVNGELIAMPPESTLNKVFIYLTHHAQTSQFYPSYSKISKLID